MTIIEASAAVAVGIDAAVVANITSSCAGPRPADLAPWSMTSWCGRRWLGWSG
jgi:hypothetical protein